MGRVDDNDYTSPNLELAGAAALSNLETVVPFGFGGQGAVGTSVGYTNIAFSIFARGYLLILLVLSSLSSFTGAGKDK